MKNMNGKGFGMSLKSDLEDIKFNLKMINLYIEKNRFRLTLKDGAEIELDSTLSAGREKK